MKTKLMENELTLIQKYNTKGSFYTDYPLMGVWTEDFTEEDYKTALKKLFLHKKDTPALLYVHFPYCSKLCYFCQCYVNITTDYAKVKRFLNNLHLEIDLLREFFEEHSITPQFQELHLGGGSPTYIREKEFDELIEKLKTLVNIEKLWEFTIEIDPRSIKPERLQTYAEKGINRISFGIQDFDPQVQDNVNRVHSPEMVAKFLTPELRKPFDSVNFDLIYGLPGQTRETFRKTMEHVIDLSPDRIALCVLGYRPDIFKHHGAMMGELPELEERTLINRDAIAILLENGYERIGLDHFAKRQDDVSKAMNKKQMHRSSLGYTPGRCTDMIPLGPSGAGRITDYYYVQNLYSLQEYEDSVRQGKLPVMRGWKLDEDLLIRRHVMHQIMNYFFVDFCKVEEEFNIAFKEYFDYELGQLSDFIEEGILELDDDKITVTELGKQFSRNICAVFDVLKRSGIDYKHSREHSTGFAKDESYAAVEA